MASDHHGDYMSDQIRDYDVTIGSDEWMRGQLQTLRELAAANGMKSFYEVRQWCMEQASLSYRDQGGLDRIEEAQRIYDWVTQAPEKGA